MLVEVDCDVFDCGVLLECGVFDCSVKNVAFSLIS